MQCYRHNDIEAVATCTDCGKGLCKSCADVFTEPLCAYCAKERNRKDVVKALTALVVSVVIFVVLLLYGGNVRGAYLWAGVPWGWIVYFVLKLLLSALIGQVVLPFKLVMSIYKIYKLKKINDYIDNN